MRNLEASTHNSAFVRRVAMRTETAVVPHPGVLTALAHHLELCLVHRGPSITCVLSNSWQVQVKWDVPRHIKSERTHHKQWPTLPQLLERTSQEEGKGACCSCGSSWKDAKCQKCAYKYVFDPLRTSESCLSVPMQITSSWILHPFGEMLLDASSASRFVSVGLQR